MQYTTSKNYGSEKMGMRMGGKRTSRPWYLLLQNRSDGEHAFRDGHRVCVALLCLLIHVLGL